MKRVADALSAARALGLARLDAQLLLAHRLRRSRAWLLAHDDAAIDAADAQQLGADFDRRAAGVPLAYIVGETEFGGLALRVTPAVLVPRPETEMLLDWALDLLADTAADVVDLGTGSGAIALALKRLRPQWAITATDASASALAVAAGNAERLRLPIDCIRGDWWQPLLGRRFALALANPPYVAGADPHLSALTHEPRSALTPEGDGLAALRHVIGGSTAQLLPGAWLLVEHGHDQQAAVQALFAAQGFARVETRRDLAGLPRCTGGCVPISHPAAEKPMPPWRAGA